MGPGMTDAAASTPSPLPPPERLGLTGYLAPAGFLDELLAELGEDQGITVA